MKKLFLLISACFLCLALHAQTEQPEPEQPASEVGTIAEAMMPNVTLHEDSSVIHWVQTRIFNLYPVKPTNKNKTVRGWSIQVFSSNAPDGQERAKEVVERMRKELPSVYCTGVKYESPFWRVRLGNFVTEEEARAFLAKVKKQFPDLRIAAVPADIINY